MTAPTDLTPRERFLRACRREPVDQVPAWLMRQAGRYMAEYQAVRGKVSFLELCKSPELCRDVTMQPIDVLGLEVGIIFSDILLPPEAMGLDLVFDEKGPRINDPVRDRAGVERLQDFDPAEKTPWPAEGIRLTHALDAKFGLPPKTTLSQRDVPGMSRSVIPELVKVLFFSASSRTACSVACISALIK